MAAAQVREACTIPGTSVRTAWLCRDKPSMKEALREAGVPTAASAAVDIAAEVRDFAERVGLPADPQAAQRRRRARTPCGSTTTAELDARARACSAGRAWSRSRSRSSSRATRASTTPSPSTGTSRSTSSRTTTRTCSRRCAPAGSRRSSSPPTGSTPRRSTASCARWAPRVIAALGIGTSRHAHGVVLRAEGAAVLRDRLPAARRRAPGTSTRRATTSTSTASGRTRSCTAARRRAAVAAVRQRDRRAAARPGRPRSPATPGVDEMQQRYGEWVIDAHLPPPGTPTQPVEAGYMANAYVRMRHPDYDTLRGMLDDVGRTLHVLRLVRIVLLGPQRRPTLEAVARSLDAVGPRRARSPRSPPAGRSASPTTPSWTRCSDGRGVNLAPVPALAGRAGPRPGVRRGRARADRACSPSCRSCTCCGSTMRCGRSTRVPRRGGGGPRVRGEALRRRRSRRPASSTSGTCAGSAHARGEFFERLAARTTGR